MLKEMLTFKTREIKDEMEAHVDKMQRKVKALDKKL